MAREDIKALRKDVAAKLVGIIPHFLELIIQYH